MSQAVSGDKGDEKREVDLSKEAKDYLAKVGAGREKHLLTSFESLQSIFKSVQLEGKTIVDFGCGPGSLTGDICKCLNLAIPSSKYIGIDCHGPFINYLKESRLKELGSQDKIFNDALKADDGRILIIESKPDDISLPKTLMGKVDVFVISYALHHLGDDSKKLLEQMHSFMAKDARLIVFEMDALGKSNLFQAIAEWEEKNGIKVDHGKPSGHHGHGHSHDHGDGHGHGHSHDKKSGTKEDPAGIGSAHFEEKKGYIDRVTKSGMVFEKELLADKVKGHFCLVFKANKSK